GAAPEGIKRPSIFVGAGLMLPWERRIAGRRLENKCRRGRHNAGAADLVVEQPAGSESDVPDDFAFHSEAWTAREQTIVRIFFVDFGRHLGGLTVGRTVDDQPVDMLQAPLVLHKVARKPIEQLGMRWRVALHSEIFGRGQNPGAKVTLPNAVDHHAGGGG